MPDFQKLSEKDARLITISYNKPFIIYHFMIGNRLGEARVKIGRKTKSIVEFFPNSFFYEREIWEKSGIIFEGHPKIERLFTEE